MKIRYLEIGGIESVSCRSKRPFRIGTTTKTGPWTLTLWRSPANGGLLGGSIYIYICIIYIYIYILNYDITILHIQVVWCAHCHSGCSAIYIYIVDIQIMHGFTLFYNGSVILYSSWVNGHFRILNWRYVSTIFLAIFCGDIPWNLGLKNRPYIWNRYLQFRILKISHW